MIVDIALFALDMPGETIAALHALLDLEEQAQAERFRFERDRIRFIARRGQLRLLIAERLDRAPASLAFEEGAYGKPALRGEETRFNASHSGGIGLCVIADGSEVGCDIERRDPRLASPEIAERFFSASEIETLRALPETAWRDGFFNCWTRKEAYVKALGLGLSLALDGFDVTLAPDDAPALLRGEPDWSLHAFRPCSGYHAAVVCRGDAAAQAPAARWFGPGAGVGAFDSAAAAA